ncbi:MAG: HD family hydrolase [Chloroflexi bacterium]|nr:HD family hydrolase [Chloroflexota bacterium]
MALRLFLSTHQLKRTPRTGWMMRGVPDVESVADHSFGVAFISLVLGEMMEQSVDKAKLLTTALLHDLPESVIGDLATPTKTYLPSGAKRKAETGALDALLHKLPCAECWQSWWQEFEEGTSIEGQIVREADRLDMLIQAYIYEQTTGNRWLEEFWPSSEDSPFQFPATQMLYEELKALRQQSG